MLVEKQIKLARLEDGQHVPAPWGGHWGQWQPLIRSVGLRCTQEPLRAQCLFCRDFRMSDKSVWLLARSFILSSAIEGAIIKKVY